MSVRSSRTHIWMPLLIAALLTACAPSPEVLKIGSLRPYGRDDYLATVVANRLAVNLSDWRVEHIFSDADGHLEELDGRAADLVDADVDLIFAYSTPAADAAKRAVVGTDIPVVFALVDDPVQAGLVSSLDNPDGQMTGVMTLALPLAGKVVETLKQVAPMVTQALLLRTPSPAYDRIVEAYRASAEQAGIALSLIEVSSPLEAAQAYLDVAPGSFDAVIESSESEIRHAGLSLAQLAARDGIPAISATGRGDGATLAYEVDLSSLADQLAFLGEKVLTLSSPSALPVEIPRRFVLRLFTDRAESIGYEFSDAALTLADDIVDLEQDDVAPPPSRW